MRVKTKEGALRPREVRVMPRGAQSDNQTVMKCKYEATTCLTQNGFAAMHQHTFTHNLAQMLTSVFCLNFRKSILIIESDKIAIYFLLL